MIPPDCPENEPARLEALHALEILDTGPEDPFDGVVRLASQIFQVPMAGVSFVDRRRQWFKSKTGAVRQETSREISFAGHVILKDDPLVVEDAAEDVRFADNPQVTSDPFLRFYAGQAVHAPDGSAVGALSIMDTAPRKMSPDEIEAMRELASMLDNELKNRIPEENQVPDVTSATLAAARPLQDPVPQIRIVTPHLQGQHALGTTALAAAPETAAPAILDAETLHSLAGDNSSNPFYLARLIDEFLEYCTDLPTELHSADPDKETVFKIENLSAMAAQIGADALAAGCLDWLSTSPSKRDTRALAELIAKSISGLEELRGILLPQD